MRTADNIRSPAYMLTILYATHFRSGILCTTLCLVSLITCSYLRKLNKRILLPSVKRFCKIHLGVLFFLSWWLISSIISYPYIGGVSFKNTPDDINRPTFLFNKLLSGHIFDFRRTHYWFTCLAVLGFIYTSVKVIMVKLTRQNIVWQHQQFYTWTVFGSLITLVIVFGRHFLRQVFHTVIPLYCEFDLIDDLFSIHFCGILLASIALSVILSCIQRMVEVPRLQHAMAYIYVLFVAVLLLKNNFVRLGPRFTYLQPSPEFDKMIDKMRPMQDGRMLLHHKVGEFEIIVLLKDLLH